MDVISGTVKRKGKIKGKLSAKPSISGKLSERPSIIGMLSEIKQILGTISVNRRDYSVQSKEAASGFIDQVIKPEPGYYLDSVEIKGMSIQKEVNEAGGYTVTIG